VTTINCDMGEAFGLYRMGDDEALMPLGGKCRVWIPRIVAADDVYLCPAGEQLIYHYTNEEDGKTLRRYYFTPLDLVQPTSTRALQKCHVAR